MQYETEVVVRISRLGRYISPQFVRRYYNAVTVGIDFTARDLQRKFRAAGHPWELSKGFDEKTPNAVEVALAAQEGGAAAVCVHGRYRSQYYSGEADRGIIKAVKDALSIPVIASGDVTDAVSGMSMLEETGCDMVMIGRGALGNPWVFRELDAAWRGQDIPPRPSEEEKISMMIRHLGMLCELKGERTGVREFRKYIMRYTKGMRGAASVRRLANEAADLREMKEVIRIG